MEEMEQPADPVVVAQLRRELAAERAKRKRAERQAETFSNTIMKLRERAATQVASAADAQNRRLAKRLRTLIAHVEPPAAGMEG